MANFSASTLVAGQSIFNQRFQSGEWRLPDVAALQVADMSAKANPTLASLRTDESRAVYAYMPIRQAATGGTARAHGHTGANGDSQASTISWSIYSEPFSVSKKQAGHNVLKWAEMYAAERQNAILNLLDRLDAWFVAQLVAAKTQYSAGGGKGTFNTDTDNYEVPADKLNYFFQYVRSMMKFNLYKGSILGIIDDDANTAAEQLSAQGSANATNYGFQFQGLNLLSTTRSILGSTSYQGSGMFFENGLVGVVPWIPTENRQPLNPAEAWSYNGGYGQFTIPELPGVPFACHAYTTRADGSSRGGQTQDLIYYEEVSIDVGFVKSPLSSFRGSNDSVVYSAGILNSPSN